jgi:hypothetical protein
MDMESKLTAGLRRVRELIVKGWCKGSNAFAAPDENGLREAVEYDDPRAVSWCLNGAAWNAALDTCNGSEIRSALWNALPDGSCAYFSRLQGWNDTSERTHGEVLAVIDTAIARSELEETALTLS